jgi:two-component system cell cycle response regulator DivK
MPKRILVVEDDALNRRLLRDLLWSRGYETIETENGQAALDLAHQQKPDLMLVDMQLPVMSGLELTRRVKSDAALNTTPVVALTAFALRADEARIRASGCDEYVTKPFDIQGLLEIVARYVGKEEAEPPGGHALPPNDGEADRPSDHAAASEWTIDAGFSAPQQESSPVWPEPVAELPQPVASDALPPPDLSPLTGATLLFAIVFTANALWPAAIWDVEDDDLYVVDLPEGVQGLTAGGDVRHAGASVGKIIRVDADEARPGAARALLRLDTRIAIQDNAVVTVRHESIIGTAYLDVRSRIRASDVLGRRVEAWTGTLRSVEAHMREVAADFPRFLERAALTVEALAKATDTSELRALSRSLDELGLLIARLARDADHIGEAKDEMIRLLAEARTLARLLTAIAEPAFGDAAPKIDARSSGQATAH